MYKSKEAKKILQKEYDWQDYGAKHEENVFTNWHMNFYLYEKFGIDKRKAHLSSLINSGQITRQEALEELKKCPVYPKLGIEQKVMKYPKREHSEFKQDKWFDRISKIIKFLRWK